MINFKVELIKLLSCMDAVFKLLHVEVARKATNGSEKKMVQTQKWATAHLSLRLGARRRGAGRPGWGVARAAQRGRRGAHGAGARGAQGRATLRHGRLGGHDTASARAWACLCTPRCAAGPAGCVLGAPSLFLDSVLFLSHFLGTVNENCSSQKIFKKKFK